MSMISISLDLTKIPKEKIVVKGDAKYLNNITVAERREPDKNGNTHMVYLYNSQTKEKTYIGSGKAIELKEYTPVQSSTSDNHDTLPF